MTFDLVNSLLSDILSIIGISLTLLVGLRARQFQRYGDRMAHAAKHSESPRPTGPLKAPDLPPFERWPDLAAEERALREQRLREQRRQLDQLRAERPISGSRDRSSAPTDGNDELAIVGVVAAVVFAALAAAAVAFARYELTVLRIGATVALTVNVVAILIVIKWRNASRPSGVGWAILLFLADAGIAATPYWYTRPWFGEGRFDDLPSRIPTRGSISARTKAALKTYDDALVWHVLTQAVGLAVLLLVLILVVFNLARHGSTTPRQEQRTNLIGVGFLVLGALAASGLLTTIPSRIDRHGSWIAGQTSNTDQAPPIGLFDTRSGELQVLVARCGNETILAMTANGHPVSVRPLPLARGEVSVADVPAATPVIVETTTTRYYATTVQFDRLPAPGGFVPARRGDTIRQLRSPGYGC